MSVAKHFHDLIWAIKWALILFFAGAIFVFIGFCVPGAQRMQDSMNQNQEGAEFPLADGHANLAQELEYRFAWTGLPNGSVQGYWANGFLDQNRLYRIQMPEEVFERMKTALRTTSPQGPNTMRWNDDDTTKHQFSDLPSPWKPGQPRIPKWWDVDHRTGLDVVEWHAPVTANAKGFGLWLAYDPTEQLLFYCSFTY